MVQCTCVPGIFDPRYLCSPMSVGPWCPRSPEPPGSWYLWSPVSTFSGTCSPCTYGSSGVVPGTLVLVYLCFPGTYVLQYLCSLGPMVPSTCGPHYVPQRCLALPSNVFKTSKQTKKYYSRGIVELRDDPDLIYLYLVLYIYKFLSSDLFFHILFCWVVIRFVCKAPQWF